MNIEFTDDPHPRNTYWEMWGLPMFDSAGAAGVMHELRECRKVLWRSLHPPLGLRRDPWLGILRLSLHRRTVRRRSPASALERQEAEGRNDPLHDRAPTPTDQARRASVTDGCQPCESGGAERDGRPSISAPTFEESGVGEVLEQLDRDWSA